MKIAFDLRPHSLLARLAFAYALICLSMWGVQRQLIYLPHTDIQPPAQYGLQGYDELTLTAGDGTKLSAWHHPAQEGYPTIVYFHGNGGHMGTRAYYFGLLTNARFGLLALDYRGYGKSEGSPSEEGFYLDARAAISYASETLKLPPERLIIYGESIGTAVAVQMATEYAGSALVLQSPFTSMYDIASLNYPWLPVSLLLRDHFDSLSKITRVHVPLLLFHGDKDAIVPVDFGKQLFKQAHDPKEAIYYVGKGHADMDVRILGDALLEFTRRRGLVPH